MTIYSVRDAFQLLKERGIARDKQEVRKWLNAGYIQADPPENRRIGWKIRADALQTFIQRFEAGEFEELQQRRKPSVTLQLRLDQPHDGPDGVPPMIDPHVVRLEEEVLSLRQQVRALRRELNDLKKVLGFPILTSAQDQDE